MRFHVPLMRVYSWFIYYKGIQGGEFQSFSKIVWRKVGLNSVPLASVKATEASIEATRTAKQGLELTKEMSQLDQRPWLAPIYIEGKPEADKPFQVSITLRNSGKTFAQKVEVCTICSTAVDESQLDFTRAERMEQGPGTISVALAAPEANYFLPGYLSHDRQKPLDKVTIEAERWEV